MRPTTFSIAGALALITGLAGTPHASACGGCFGPTGQPTVVTAHRMAISLSSERTILWDQFEYAGNPEDFVWVLPVAGDQDVVVELADNAFFQALQETTQIQLSGPFRSTGGGGGGFGCGAASAELSADGPMSPPVTVYHQGAVGPYETATIGSEDPEALLTWMQDRGYSVPDEMLPTISYYVERGMNFVALRLSPGESVTRMQPVRVITPGMNVSCPLRMVAAGVADSVALELFVIAEGRYEAANFPNGEVDREEIVYDWATTSYNYDELADAVIASGERRTWLTELAAPVSEYRMESFSVTDEAGEVHTAEEDWAAATQHLAGEPTVTRMRADLPVEALAEDLVLAASTAGPLYGFIDVTRDVNFETASSTTPLTEDGARMAGVPGPVLWMLGLGVAFVVRRRMRG